ncbi:hypothetical protein JOD14_000978 [Enterococcus lemanii]|nr:hypothetical protein [Enterococcus lemanii]
MLKQLLTLIIAPLFVSLVIESKLLTDPQRWPSQLV